MQRVPSFAYAHRAIEYSTIHSTNILKYQKQISSGLRFEKPSEEPIPFRLVSSLTSRRSELTADQATIQRSTSILNASVVQVQEFIDLATQAKTLAQQGVQAIDEGERRALAIEVDGLLDALQQVSLSKFNDRYLYGGTRSQQPPFEFIEPQGKGGLEVHYNGSHVRSSASVGDTLSVDTYYSGLQLFGRRGREATVLDGASGAKPGPGTHTMTGQARLIVAHETTTFDGASGVAPGTRSATDDTVLGPLGSHTLTIVDQSGDGSSGTVSLNGGIPITFTNADTDLRVVGPGGHLVYVDTTNISAGFNGTIDVGATGTLSTDEGATEIPIDFSSKQIIIDSTTNLAVTIDTTNVRKAAVDHLDFPGTSNAFEVFFDLANDLRNADNLDSQDLALTLGRRLGEIDKVTENALEVLGQQSAALKTLDSLSFRITDLLANVEIRMSDVQSTDIPDAVLNLERSQALLQYTFAVTAQVNSLGILEFLT